MSRYRGNQFRGFIHPYRSPGFVPGDVGILTAGGALGNGSQISLDGLTMQSGGTGAAGAYNGIYCPAFDNFIMCGPGFIRVWNNTPNATYTNVTLPSGFVNGASIAYHPPTQRVVLANYQGTSAHYSTTGGLSWVTSASPVGSSDHMTYNYDNGDLVLVTRSSTLFRSSDAGTTWTSMPAPSLGGLNLGVGYAFGKYWVPGYNIAQIASTINNGSSWQYTALPGGSYSRIHYAAQRNILFTGSAGAISWTTNGTTWNTRSGIFSGASIRSLGYAPSVDRFFVGTSTHMFISQNLTDWTQMSGSSSFDHYAMAVKDTGTG
ncbi:hypothetical protein D3C72_320310 [compost metagenome]